MRKILLVFITLWLIVPAIYAQKVGLVLSGGGAKGLTHIGIIRALEENNIPIDYIAAVSYTHLDVYKRQILGFNL